MKRISSVHRAPPGHWVGDGFPVRSLFSYDGNAESLSPFLLLDYAAPTEFKPASSKRGVGEHPHRGFETVTIVYQGEVDHRDSTGAGGHIGPGDVQWMTAGSGLVHEEFHSEAFTRSGGVMEMVQLWVNLLAKNKLTAPGYQTLLNADIPSVDLANDGGRLRVIAGEFAGARGPARTFSPINVWDLRLNRNAVAEFEVAQGHTLAVVVLHGMVQVNDEALAREAELVQFEREGSRFKLEANSEATVLVLSGEPLNEPIVGYGPFVMNSREEIAQAITDFNRGKFGRLPQ